MFKRFVVGCVTLWMLGAHAAPLVYTSTQYTTAAAASAGADADFNTDSSASAPLPLLTSATVFDATEFASGSGIAANGLLTTQAEASSLAGVVSAVGTSEFLGTFNGYSSLRLSIDLTSLNFSDAAAFSAGTLFVLVTVDGTTYLDQQLSSSGLYNYTLGPSIGGSYMFSLLLSSEAHTSIGGDASNFSSVAFAVSPVPEPSTLLLFAIGLTGCFLRQRRMPLH